MGCSGLRKGAWTSEEDELLRKCMEQYGAVRWSLVPKRASLSRCPKSCRLRWSNYLCPSIKRGKFEDAEVDLIIRLHKLLGNRWSLIAGRLPGRTANDVKNFWNTHLSKQLLAEKHGKEAEAAYVEVIKPQPQTIPWNWKWSKDNEASESNNQQEEANILRHLSTSRSTNATCLESKNFSASNIEEVGMMQELQAQFRSEDIGSFGHDDSLLEGFLGWEDMHADISLWSDFEYI